MPIGWQLSLIATAVLSEAELSHYCREQDYPDLPDRQTSALL